MITYADKAISKSKYPLLTENEALKQYFLDNIILWSNTLESLSLSQDYKISNGQNSKRKLTRADADEVTKMLNFWENEWHRLQGTSLTAPKINTIYTVGYNNELNR